MAWRRIGDKPLSEPMMSYVADAYMREVCYSQVAAAHLETGRQLISSTGTRYSNKLQGFN